MLRILAADASKGNLLKVSFDLTLVINNDVKI